MPITIETAVKNKNMNTIKEQGDFLFFDNDCRILSEGDLCGKRQLLLEEALQEI